MKLVKTKKQEKTSIKLNFMMNAVLSLSSVIFPLVTFPYASRVLQPEGIGKVSFATSFISYFCMFAQLGIPTYGVRACAKVRDDKRDLTKVAQELLWINMIMSIISYIVLSGVLLTVPKFKTDKMLYIIVSMTIILNAIGMEWLYRALEQYTYITIRSVVFKAVALVLMFFLIHESDDYVLYGGITIFAASASNILNFINAHNYIGMKPLKNYNFRRHIKPIVIFFAMSCATTIYTNLDTVMLGFMKTNADVGLYNAAVKIKSVLVSIVTSLGAVLLPRASYYVEKGMMEEFRAVSKKAIHFVFLIAMPLMVYFIIYARPCVLFLSGEAYSGAVRPMQIIMPTLLFIGLSNLLGIQMLIPMGKEKIVLYSEIIGAVVDLGLNAVLIPVYAATGAAIGTVVAELAVLIVQYVALKREVNTFIKSIHYVSIIMGIVLASVVSYQIVRLKWGSFMTLLLTSIVFWGIYGSVLLITKEEMLMQFLKEIRKKYFRK